MRKYIENIGEDLDGNRGVPTTCYEIEESDRSEIKDQVEEYLSMVEEPEETITIVLIDTETEEDVYFEVNVKDYK